MTPRQRKALVEFLRQAASAATSLSLYSERHRMTAERAARALDLLSSALDDLGTVTFVFLGGEVYLDGAPLEREPAVEQLVRQAARHEIGHVTLSRGATAQDVEALLRVFARRTGAAPASTPHLTIGAVEVDESRLGGGTSYFAIPSYSDIPPHLVARLGNAYAEYAPPEALDLDAVVSLAAGFLSAFRNEANPLLALAPVRRADERAFDRAVNACILVLAQGMALGLEGPALHDLGVAALLHDLGTLRAGRDGAGEDDPRFLTEHAVRGAEYLLDVPGAPRMAAVTAFEHHMRHDLSGHPEAPPGWRLSLCSEMTMVSSRFDALRSEGGYDGPGDYGRMAAEMLERAGTELHPELTLHFLKVVGDLERRG